MNEVTPTPFVDPLVEHFEYRARTNGSSYAVRIGLPRSYRHTEARYPVLVLLDADVAFATTYEIAGLESTWSRVPIVGKPKLVPEFVVVGISMPDGQQNVLRRNFEYMPDSNPAEYSAQNRAYLEEIRKLTGAELKTGGAPDFLRILESEILPVVERLYRIDRGRRVLFGQSAGGTFCCYTLLTKPELFTDYIIVSPGILDSGIFKLEEAWAAAHADLSANVFLSAGDQEVHDPFGIMSATSGLAERLLSRRYPSLQLRTWFIPGATHIQTAAPSVARALAAMSE
jgi:predicted alpha/beta superfamily hydrolase